jgi:hypothetical protein
MDKTRKASYREAFLVLFSFIFWQLSHEIDRFLHAVA